MMRLLFPLLVLLLLGLETEASTYRYRPLTGICKAATDGDVKAVQAFLAENPESLHERDRDTPPLLWAASYGRVEVVELLLTCGAPADSIGAGGWTALHYAAGRSVEIMRALLARNALVNVTNKDGDTPLLLACAYGRNVGTVRLLLEHKADPNFKNNDGATPLQNAAFDGEHGICALLIQHGAEVNAHGFRGATALHWAVDGEKRDMVKFLLANGANPRLLDDDGKSALDWAEERAAKKRWWQRGKLRGIAKLLRRAPAPPAATKSSHGKR